MAYYNNTMESIALDLNLTFGKIDVLKILFSILGIVGNTVLCYVIFHRKKHSSADIYLFSQAVCNVLYCAVSIVYNYRFHLVKNVVHNFDTWNLCALSLPFINLYTTTMFSIERYIAVCHPLKPQYLSGKPRTKITIALIWVIGLFSALPIPSYIHNRTLSGRTFVPLRYIYKFNMLTFIFVIPAVMIGVIYISIIVSVWRSQRIIKRYLPHVSASRRAAVKQTIVISATVVIQYTFCILPSKLDLYTGFSIKIWQNSNSEMERYLISFQRWLFDFLAVFSCVIDPYLYGIVSKKYRKDFKDALFPFCKYQSLHQDLELKVI